MNGTVLGRTIVLVGRIIVHRVHAHAHDVVWPSSLLDNARHGARYALSDADFVSTRCISSPKPLASAVSSCDIRLIAEACWAAISVSLSRRSSWVRACCLPDVALLWVQLDRVNGKAATELRQNGNFVALWSAECDDAEALLGAWVSSSSNETHTPRAELIASSDMIS